MSVIFYTFTITSRILKWVPTRDKTHGGKAMRTFSQIK